MILKNESSLHERFGYARLRLVRVLGAALLASAVARGVAGDQGELERGKAKMNPNVVVTLTSAKQQYAAGERIPVTITLKNGGNTPITVVVRSAWLDHLLSMTDERGNEVPETAYATATKDGAEAGRRAIRKLAPGETISDTIDLEKVFELNRLGVYKLTSRRHVSEKDTLEEPFAVSSNQLQIKIVQ